MTLAPMLLMGLDMRTHHRFPTFIVAACLLAATSGCSVTGETSHTDDAISSSAATIVDFAFEAEVVAARNADARTAITAQLMYSQGIFATIGGNGQVGNVGLSDIVETESGDSKTIHYRASLPVAWPTHRLSLPSSYELVLPHDTTKLAAFNAKYDGVCGANQYGRDSFWHDWDPSNCVFDEDDVVRAQVTIQPHAKVTQNKFPEYDEIWKDDRLDLVAVFAIVQSNNSSDWAYTESSRFAADAVQQLIGATTAENASSKSILKDTTITGKARIGGKERDVKIDILVIRSLTSAGADFDARYDALTENADMILYNGHAGLGRGVNELARMGRVAPNKYQLMLFNGCQTFAYLDTTMFERRREVNGSSDPFGTRFLDVMANALPGYPHNLASMSSTLLNAALQADTPRHYNDIMSDMPSGHVVVVFGEDDNVFTP